MRDGFDEFVRTRTTGLLRVAYLLTGDRHAAEDRRPEVALAHHDPAVWGITQPDHSDAVAVRDTVLEALRSLPPKQRAAVVLRYLDPAPDLLDRIRTNDPFGIPFQAADPWLTTGRTPAGVTYCVQTLVIGDEVRTFRGIDGGPPDFRGHSIVVDGRPDGIRNRLPDGQGIVVATQADKLEYRVKDGDWLPADAVSTVLPDAAIELRVTRGGRTAVEPIVD